MKPEAFSRETTGLAEVTRPEVVELQDGDEFDLRIEPVAKTIGGDTVRMLAYNRSVPGPTLRVRQDSKLIVHSRMKEISKRRSTGMAYASRTATTERTRHRRRSLSARRSRMK